MPEVFDPPEHGGEPSTPSYLIDTVLSFAELKPDELFIDAGCGEGIIIEKAVTKYKVRAVGIEYNEKTANRAKNRIRNAGIEDRVKIIIGDFYDFNFKNADIVYLYLAIIEPRLVDKLKNELKTSARTLSLAYLLPGWKPKKIKEVTFFEDGEEYTDYAILYQQSHLRYLYSRFLNILTSKEQKPI